MFKKISSFVFCFTMLGGIVAYAATTNPSTLSPHTALASTADAQSPAENSEQYKLTINKDENTTDAHVEILPNNDGEYWIPKGYNVKVTGDYKDGYMQSAESNILNINEAKTVNLESTVAPPQKLIC